VRNLIAFCCFCSVLGVFILLPLSSQFGRTQAADVINHVPQAEVFVRQIADEVIDILVTSNDKTVREARFRELLRAKADLRRIGRFTLGRFGRTISREEFATYQSLLETFIIKVYANRLGAYSNQKITILSSQQKNRNIIVKSRIEFATGRDPIILDWWLIETAPATYKLFDVSILGIWMAQEQRATFLSVLNKNQGNFDILLNHIREQVENNLPERN